MPKEAEMNWYAEEAKFALSRLEKLLSEKKLTEMKDFNDDIASRAYGLLTRIPSENRIEYAYLAELLRTYYQITLSGPPCRNARVIVEHATVRFKVENLQRMYKLEHQPCV